MRVAASASLATTTVPHKQDEMVLGLSYLKPQTPIISAGVSNIRVAIRTSRHAASNSGVPSGIPSSSARVDTNGASAVILELAVSGKSFDNAGLTTTPQSEQGGGGGILSHASCREEEISGGDIGIINSHVVVKATAQEVLAPPPM